MSHDRYDLQWAGRCQYDIHDKIWGWFFYQDPTASPNPRGAQSCYVFWAKTGKTPSFKKHSYTRWEIGKLVQTKTDRKYVELSIEDLLKLWPTLYEDLDNRFIFHLLAENL